MGRERNELMMREARGEEEKGNAKLRGSQSSLVGQQTNQHTQSKKEEGERGVGGVLTVHQNTFSHNRFSTWEM